MASPMPQFGARWDKLLRRALDPPPPPTVMPFAQVA
jgi:hypothetical protein